MSLGDVVDAKLFGEVFITLFVIMDPPGTVPVFLSLAGGRSRAARTRMAWQAVLVSFAVIVAFALFGQQVFEYLGITLPALQGAGGLLLLLVALQLLTGNATDPEETENVNVALVPLGTPLLAGPGAIVATIVFVQRIDGVPDLVAVAAAIIAVHLVMWVSLHYSVLVLRLLRDGGITLVTRISGLLLSAIAVQLMADSVIAFAATAG